MDSRSDLDVDLELKATSAMSNHRAVKADLLAVDIEVSVPL